MPLSPEDVTELVTQTIYLLSVVFRTWFDPFRPSSKTGPVQVPVLILVPVLYVHVLSVLVQ